MYCVIMGDIINSKKMNNESLIKTQSTMEKIFQKINCKYAKFIMTNFGQVRGDAFEGVTYSQAESIWIIEDLIKLFYTEANLRIRISCVSGELVNNSLNRDESNGPAFYTAVKEIDKLKEKTKDSNNKRKSDWFQVSLITGTIAQPLVNAILDLLSAITNEWTDKQREIIWNMSDASFQQNVVSERLGLSPSIISRQLKSANYKIYREALDNLNKYLEEEEIKAVEEELKEKEIIDNSKKKNVSYTVLYSIGLRCNKQGDYDLAEKYIKKALDRAKKEYGEEDIRLVPIYNGLVQSYVEQASFNTTSEVDKERLFNSAKMIIDKSLTVQNKAPKDIKIYIQTINAKANLFLEMRRTNEALNLLIQIEELIIEFLGKKNAFIYACYNNIALAYKELKNPKEAFKYLMKNKPEIEKEQNPQSIAEYLHNMGLVLTPLKRHTIARKCLIKARENYEKTFPSKHHLILEVNEALNKL